MTAETILIVDDNPDTLHSLDRMLTTWGWKTVLARFGMEAWGILLREDAPLIVMVDWNMPRMDGIQLCEMIRMKAVDRCIYLILMTVEDRPEISAEGLLAGADEILFKPIYPDELKARLHAAGRILASCRKAQDQDSSLLIVSRDELTGLWNSKGVLRVMDHQLHRACRRQEHTGLILLWLDDFEMFNSLWGEDISQRIVLRTARELQISLRSYDELGRTAPDKFLAVLPDCTLEQALILAERLQKCVETSGEGYIDESYPLTASAGVTAASAHSFLDAVELVHLLERTLARSGRYARRCIASSEPALAPFLSPALPLQMKGA
ncbi:MAG: diguanylate cyclase [Anaerolineales bacterium]|nr:diguanylate cyclase [Anaerolineales bacterium]